MAAMVAPAMGADTSATVLDAETTYSLSATYSTATTFSTNGAFTATLVATDNNGEDSITETTFDVTWTDEDGAQTATLSEISDSDPLTRTYQGTGAIPYYQDYNSELSISGPGSSSATVTINNELKGITAGNVVFGEINSGGASVISPSTITNTGNIDVTVDAATPTALTSASTSGSMNAPTVGTLPTIEDLAAGTGTGTVSFTLTALAGTPAASDYIGTVTFTLE